MTQTAFPSTVGTKYNGQGGQPDVTGVFPGFKVSNADRTQHDELLFCERGPIPAGREKELGVFS